MLSKDFFIKREKGRFLNLPSLVLDNLNIEVNNGFIFQPLTVERKLNMTAPMQISGERGSLCNFLIRKQYKKGFGSFSAIGAYRTNAGSEKVLERTIKSGSHKVWSKIRSVFRRHRIAH